MNIRDADTALNASIERLRSLVDDKKEDSKRVVANDRQQVVIFSTFREICTYRLQQGDFRLCRHPEHEAANTGIAKCDESLCPRITAALIVKPAA